MIIDKIGRSEKIMKTKISAIKFISLTLIIIIAVSMISGCSVSGANLGGWNHIQTVRIYGYRNRLSTDDYMRYINSQYVENIDFLRYNYCTTETDTSHFDENGIQLRTSGGIKFLDYRVFRPLFIFGYNLSVPNSLDMEFEITEGRMFEKNDECIIMRNSKMTEDALQSGEDDDPWNSLEVGDRIVFDNEENDIFKVFTVVGILKENINNDRNSNTRMIHTTLESAEYFDVLNQERSNITHIFSEYPEKDFLMGYEAVVYLTYNSYDKFSRYVDSLSDGTQGIEPIDPVSLKPIYS